MREVENNDRSEMVGQELIAVKDRSEKVGLELVGVKDRSEMVGIELKAAISRIDKVSFVLKSDLKTYLICIILILTFEISSVLYLQEKNIVFKKKGVRQNLFVPLHVRA